MVDRTDLAEVNNLYREFGQLEQAISNLDSGGHIGSMVVVGETPDVPSAIVQTGFMRDNVPTQMIEGIRQLMLAREAEICSRLSELGLGGVSPQPRTAAAPKGRK